MDSVFPAETGKWAATPLGAAIAVSVLFNLFTLVIFMVASYFHGPKSFHDALLIGVPMMAVDGLIEFPLFFLIRATVRLPGWGRWSLVALGVVAVALLQAAFDTELRIRTGTLLHDYPTPYTAYIRAATLNMYNSGMFAALMAFQSAYMTLREHQRLLVASRANERDAQMLALRFQLNPHFLFNTLNAVSSLVVVGRAEEAETMIERLSSFLRASLTARPDRMVSLEEEFAMLEAYLEIESVRFGERLVAGFDLPSALLEACVPPFLLQPLVENAMKYAVAPARRPVRVTVRATEADGRLLLSVDDDGDGGASPNGTGVGLANVRERLRLTYGGGARLDAGPEARGYRAAITMPLERGESVRREAA